jgi:PAS domain S-box-containing protein
MEPSPPPGDWRAREILAALDLLICVWEPKGKILYANPKLLDVTGHQARDIAGLNFYGDLISAPDLNEGERGDSSGPQVHFAGMRRADGGVSWVKVKRSSVRDQSGKIKCFVAVLTLAPEPSELADQPVVHPAKSRGSGKWLELKHRLLALPQPLINPDEISPGDLSACLRDGLAGLFRFHMVEPSVWPVELGMPCQGLPRAAGLLLAEAALDILHYSLPWDEDLPDPEKLHLLVESEPGKTLLLRVFAQGSLLSVRTRPTSRLRGPLGSLARRVIAARGSLFFVKGKCREIRVALPA